MIFPVPICSDAFLLQLYSVYSADKLNNLKGQHEGHCSLPSPSPDHLCGDYYRGPLTLSDELSLKANLSLHCSAPANKSKLKKHDYKVLP